MTDILNAPLGEQTSPALSDALPLSSDYYLKLQHLLKIINLLTADASPVINTDYLVTYDASAGAPKKVLPANLPVTDSKVSFTDNTTGNASALAHGYLPKLSGSASNVLLGDGTWGSLLGLPAVVRKTADETVNNSAVFQNDDHLKIPVVANKVYKFELVLIVTAAANTTDIKLTWTVPAGCTGYWGTRGSTVGSADGLAPVGTGGTPVNNMGLTATAAYGLGNGITFMTIFDGLIINGANAGDVQLQWAQNTAGASDTKVLASSVIVYQLLN